FVNSTGRGALLEKGAGVLLSGPSPNYGDAPRAPRRTARKARGGTIPGVFDRRAPPRGGMHRRPNAAVIRRRATKLRSTGVGVHPEPPLLNLGQMTPTGDGSRSVCQSPPASRPDPRERQQPSWTTCGFWRRAGSVWR